MKLYKCLIILLTFLGFSASIDATIIYDADGTSTFTLIKSGGMVVTAVSGPEPTTMIVTGTGVASLDANVKTAAGLFPGTPLTQTSEVSGSAAPAFGTSTATVLNSTLIVLDNSLGSGSAIAEFSFSYDWFVKITQTDPLEALLEASSASSFFHLSGFAPSGTETLAIDEGLGAGIVPVADWLFHPEIMVDFADISASMMLSGSKTVTAFVTLGAGRTDSFSVITDASGFAIHKAVPEPLSLILISMLLLILSLCIRRKA